MRGTAFNPMSQGGNVLKTIRAQEKWMHKQLQLCWKCQKDSVPQRGCVIELSPGLKKYVCKTCVDARKPKEEI